MANITVKNIPPELYDRLKRLAEAHRRSVNSEIIACIEQVVSSKPIDPDWLLARARQIREKTAPYAISDEDFNEAKQRGRP
jgi:plasmid stability protein